MGRWTASLVLLLLLGCGGTNDAGGTNGTQTDAAFGVPDAGAGAVDSGAASSCTCIAVELTVPGRTLCDCPVFEYGCEGAPQTFQTCDVAPPCWSVVTDPGTGCPMPSTAGSLGNPDCSCFPNNRHDAGLGD